MIKKIQKLSAALAISTILSAQPALADKGIAAIGLNLSTTGVGAEARTPVAENLYGRLGFNYVKFTHNFNGGKIKLKTNLELISAPIMIDWHPIDGSGFRLSAGVAYNGNKITGKGNAPQGVTIDGKYYRPAEVGDISAELTLGNAIAGVASIGYDNSFISNSALSFNCELGLMYTGKPKLSITSNGTLANEANRVLRPDVDKSFNDIEKYLKVFPVLKIGVKYNI